MNPLIRENRYSGLRHHAKVHSFRIFTVFYRGGLLRKTRTAYVDPIQGGMEIVGDNIPPPWGPRIEFIFREIGWLYLAADHPDSRRSPGAPVRNCGPLASTPEKRRISVRDRLSARGDLLFSTSIGSYERWKPGRL
jgi:hypothetical protein